MISLGLVAGVAMAGVDKAKLIGKWSGEISAKFGEHAQKEQVRLEFKKDGTVIASDKDGKAEERKFAIKGDKIVFFGKDGKEEVHLTGIVLTNTKLSGDFRPVDKEKVPPGLSIKLDLTRAK